MQTGSAPLFLVYLVLLMHNYFVGLVSPRPAPRAPSATFAATARRTLIARAMAIVARAYGACVSFVYYMHAMCSESSFPPHCLLVHVEVPSTYLVHT
jgi:hypothetical protein